MSTAEDKHRKPSTNESPSVNLTIKGLEDENLLMFKTEKKTPLEKLMSVYSNWVSVDRSENRFFFNGREIRAEDTPDALGMEDGDEMHVLRCQCGIVHVKKPETDDSPRITLTVRSLTGKEVLFRIKRDSQLTKLMEAYCDREFLDISGVLFIYCGRCIEGRQTPDELGMANRDVIHSLLRIIGS